MDEEDASPDQKTARFNCPGCAEEVDVPGISIGQLVRCPYCNTDFFASPEHVNAAVVDDTPTETPDRDLEINRLRIEQFAALRRGAIRSRSWWIIAELACLFMVLDAAGQIFIYLTAWHRWGIAPTAGALVLIAAAFFGRHAKHRGRQFQKEIDTSALSEPTDPPDFSALGDGSNLLKQFEEIR